MEFRTTIKPRENRGLIRHDDGIMMLGSCFSDNIGSKLRQAMMNVDINPFGTIYNPFSIAASIDRIIDARVIDGSDMFQANGVWNSFAFHSRYSKSDKMLAMKRMNERIISAHSNLRNANVIIITLGTAVVYRWKQTGKVVSNCHKVPQHEFIRKIEDIDALTGALDHIVTRLHEFNPNIHVIFTVSPIRHIADGLETNQISKASLRIAVSRIAEHYKAFVDYFPAFEIMIDDLRDYRFYAADMVHPSDTAIEYIWHTFQATYFDDRTAQAVARCERVFKRMMHRPMSDSREAIERFRIDTITVVKNLTKEYPYLTNIADIKKIIEE